MSEQATERDQDLEQALDAASEAVSVEASKLDQVTSGPTGGESLGIESLLGVAVQVTVEIGRAKLPLGDLVRMQPGSLVELQRLAHEPVDVFVNGKAVAQGEIVVIGENYGVRISKVLGGSPPAKD